MSIAAAREGARRAALTVPAYRALTLFADGSAPVTPRIPAPAQSPGRMRRGRVGIEPLPRDCRVVVVSNGFARASWERLRAALPPLPMRFASGSGQSPRPDLVGTLIDAVDALERLALSGLRLLRRGLGTLSLGVVWRGLAALTGIGMVAALVTGLTTPQEAEAARATGATTPEPSAAAPAIRDVRVQPLSAAIGPEGWVGVVRPIALFGLETPELDRRSGYEARRSADGSRREDMLTFGEFADGKPFFALKLLVNRGGEADRASASLSQPFVIALVRDGAARGLSVGRSGMVTAIETKFGPVETADVGLTDGEHSRACIGFRHQDAAAHLSFTGWWCGGESRHADRAQLTCMLDRVDLLSAGDDHTLRALFAEFELNRRPGCSQPRLSASGRKSSWLDADAKAPALKNGAGKTTR